jgi:DNA repair protein RadC
MKKSFMDSETNPSHGTTYQNRIPMQFWAEDDIPSEKLLLKGTASLSDAELLSILIGSGGPGENPLDIAQNILASCQNNLCEFWKLGLSDLQKFKGIGRQRALQIISMISLSRRRSASEIIPRDKIKTSRDAYTILHSLIGELPYEEFWMLLLDRANKIIKKVKVSEGGISGTVVDPKKIFCIALEHHATNIILGHNHPSGVCAPSEADLRITKKIKDSGTMLEIAVLDHLIVAFDNYYSFADEGSL